MISTPWNRRPTNKHRAANGGVARIDPSIGSVRDGYDTALAETFNDLVKAEVIHRHGPFLQFRSRGLRRAGMERLELPVAQAGFGVYGLRDA